MNIVYLKSVDKLKYLEILSLGLVKGLTTSYSIYYTF